MDPDLAPAIRTALDADGDQLARLIFACWAEYPGSVIDPGENPEFWAIATWAERLGGRFWVAERGGRIVGSAGIVPAADPAGQELAKLYVARDARRQGLAARFILMVEDEARRRGAAFVELWSDARFFDAHRLYRRHGYVQDARSRALGDASNSVEYHFLKRF
jgi:putative acetyltransferase